MKTTPESKLRTAADKARALGHEATKHPVSSILSLCMVAGIAATIASFSQTNDTPPKVEVTTTAQTMPVSRTITSADGRTIDVVIVSKSETAIKAKRADGKEFEITLDKLSDADKAFVAGLVEMPAKKIRVLVLDNQRFGVEALQSYPLDLVIWPQTETPGFAGTACDISTITPEQLAKYDIIWGNDTPVAQRKQWRELLKNYTGVVCESFPAVTTRNQWLNDKKPTVMKNKPFVKEDRNFVFYNTYEISKDGDVVGSDPNIYKQVIDIALKLRD